MGAVSVSLLGSAYSQQAQPAQEVPQQQHPPAQPGQSQ